MEKGKGVVVEEAAGGGDGVERAPLASRPTLCNWSDGGAGAVPSGALKSAWIKRLWGRGGEEEGSEGKGMMDLGGEGVGLKVVLSRRREEEKEKALAEAEPVFPAKSKNGGKGATHKVTFAPTAKDAGRKRSVGEGFDRELEAQEMGPPAGKKAAIARLGNGEKAAAFFGAVGKSYIPVEPGEITVWKPRTERKASFQLRKSDITKDEETERLQRRNGQLLESMLASRQSKDIFEGRGGVGARLAGVEVVQSPAGPTRVMAGGDGNMFGFVPFMRRNFTSEVQHAWQGERDCRGRSRGEAEGSAGGAQGVRYGSAAARSRRGRQVFQDTDFGPAGKASQRHADMLSRVWAGIATQPSLLTPIFAPYKDGVEVEGEGKVRRAGSNERADQPSPLTPLFNPYKFSLDDVPQAQHNVRPPPIRATEVPAPPGFVRFPFAAGGKRSFPSSSNAALPPPAPPLIAVEAGRGNDADYVPEGSHARRRNVSSSDTRSKCQSSHYSNSPWPLDDGISKGLPNDEGGSRLYRQHSLNLSSGTERLLASQPSVQADKSRILIAPASLQQKLSDPDNHGEGGPALNPRAMHAQVVTAIEQPLLQRVTFEPGDSSRSTPSVFSPQSNFGVKPAGLHVLGKDELIVPSQSLQGRGGESEPLEGIPSVDKLCNIGSGDTVETQDQGVPGGAQIPQAGASERIGGNMQCKRNILKQVTALGPNYISSRSVDESSKKFRSLLKSGVGADVTAEDGNGDNRTLDRSRLSSWINRWLPFSSALPACQPSNSKSPAGPTERPMSDVPVDSSPDHARLTSHDNFNRFSGFSGRGLQGGSQRGQDRWFLRPETDNSPFSSAPSAAAMAIVGRASKSLAAPQPFTWRQGMSSVWPVSTSQPPDAPDSSKKPSSS